MNYKYTYPNAWIFRLPILRNYDAITLGPYIFFNGPVDLETLRHEMKHVEQIGRFVRISRILFRSVIVGVLWFYMTYLAYFIFYLVKLRNWNAAYHAIPFEIEAYKTKGTKL